MYPLMSFCLGNHKTTDCAQTKILSPEAELLFSLPPSPKPVLYHFGNDDSHKSHSEVSLEYGECVC